jgi:hypothetical protein
VRHFMNLLFRVSRDGDRTGFWAEK